MPAVLPHGRAIAGFAAAAALLVCLLGSARADDLVQGLHPTVDDQGTFGLITTPSARMGDDGDFNFGYSHEHPYARYFLTATPLPWTQLGFMFNDIEDRLYNFQPFSGTQTDKPKEFDAKFRLLQEDEFWPDVAVGVTDFGGPGLFESQYFVASRRFYDVDASLGIGWGRLSGRNSFPNPFGYIDPGFKQNYQGSLAGGLTVGSLFHGQDSSLFGGFEYHTPWKGVSFKVEWDPDTYQNVDDNNTLTVYSPINIAAVYQPFSFVDFSVGLERGNAWMARITFHANFNRRELPPLDTPPPKVEPRVAPPSTSGRPLAETSLPLVDQNREPTGVDRLYDEAEREGYDIEDVAIAGGTMTLTVQPIAGVKAHPPKEFAQAALNCVDSVNRVIVRKSKPQPKVSLASYAPASAALAAQTGTGSRPTGVLLAADAEPAHAAGATPAAPQPSFDQVAIAMAIFDELKGEDMTGAAFSIQGRRAYLIFSQQKYRNTAQAIGRAARIVVRHLPPQVEIVTIELTERELATASVTMLRKDIENAVAGLGSPEEIWTNSTLAAGGSDEPAKQIDNPDKYPGYSWSLTPQMRQHIGGPEGYFLYQIYASLSGELTLLPGWSMGGELGHNIYNDFNRLSLPSNSELPHVRSDIEDYLEQGQSGILDLQTDYMFNIAPEWYGRMSAGLLEWMYAGADGEILYRPFDERWAIGIDANHVYQRGFNELFTFLDYQVTTAFLNFYYKVPYYHLLAEVSAGTYLAHDKGATFTLSREFDNGMRAGIWVTKTDVPASVFGEGEFDKGFFLSIPLDLVFGVPRKEYANYSFRPLTRDGGQQVDIEHPLYQETDGDDFDSLSRTWPTLMK